MQKCRVKMSKTIERSEQHFARVSPPVVLGHVDSSQVSIGFKRIDYRTVSNARALKRRHRFENSKRRPASTIAKKGHGKKDTEKSNLPVVIYDNPTASRSPGSNSPGRSNVIPFFFPFFFLSPHRNFFNLSAYHRSCLIFFRSFSTINTTIK